MTQKQMASKGGLARAEYLTPERRREISIKAAMAAARVHRDNARLRKSRRAAYAANGKPRFEKGK